MVDRQQAFISVCHNYGFDPDDYEREFKTYGKGGALYEVKLVGFEGERCVLEIQFKGPHKRSTPSFIKELPSDCMRHIRLFYKDMAQQCREEGLLASATLYDQMVRKMTLKIKRAGHEADPVAIFNAWGNPENAKICIAPGKANSMRYEFT